MKIHNTIFKGVLLLLVLLMGTSLMAQPKSSPKTKANTFGNMCYIAQDEVITLYITVEDGQYLHEEEGIVLMTTVDGNTVEFYPTLQSVQSIGGYIEYAYQIAFTGPIGEYIVDENLVVLEVEVLWFEEGQDEGIYTLTELVIELCN